MTPFAPRDATNGKDVVLYATKTLLPWRSNVRRYLSNGGRGYLGGADEEASAGFIMSVDLESKLVRDLLVNETHMMSFFLVYREVLGEI